MPSRRPQLPRPTLPRFCRVRPTCATMASRLCPPNWCRASSGAVLQAAEAGAVSWGRAQGLGERDGAGAAAAGAGAASQHGAAPPGTCQRPTAAAGSQRRNPARRSPRLQADEGQPARDAAIAHRPHVGLHPHLHLLPRRRGLAVGARVRKERQQVRHLRHSGTRGAGRRGGMSGAAARRPPCSTGVRHEAAQTRHARWRQPTPSAHEAHHPSTARRRHPRSSCAPPSALGTDP